MFKFTKLDGMAVFGAAAAEGPALTASYPYARPSFAQSSFVWTMKKLAVQWRAKRKVRRNVYALSALSDSQLRDIGLNRANIVSAVVEAAGPHHWVHEND